MNPAAAPGWTPERIEALLHLSPRAVERAILALHGRQTSGERAAGLTSERNGAGFGAFDAPTFSFVAEFLSRGGHLRRETCARYAPRLAAYAGQLCELANG